ncbi:MAG: hypothetical protein SF097_25210 [Acidobacteriota bacterium]|nr:hypothetical protein [Acidobacteriota bacterium]
MKTILFAVALLCSIGGIVSANGPIPPIQSGYGANGAFTVKVDKFPSPLYDNEKVQVFRPVELTTPVPIVFFAPGFNNNDPDEYRPLINHIVSRGFALVYAPFQVVSGDISLNEKRYNTIWAGFEEAIKRFGSSFDLTRIGFAGHSYGAAALPAMMQRGVVGKGWGKNGAFVYSMAPWYVFQFGAKEYVNWPQHVKLLVQVYEDDGVCDHRLAKEIYDRTNLPASEKEFVMLRSERRFNYTLDAEHGTPSTGSDENALDYYGVYRVFDALADYAFNSSAAGKQIALGNGSAEQRFMGKWPDGQPVREMLAGDCIPVTRSSSSFLFPNFGSTASFATVSSASLKGDSVAPNSLVSAWGTNFSAYPMSADGAPPVALNGTSVRVKDSVCVERFAPLFFVSPTQINYLIPPETAPGAATISVFNEAGAVSVATVQISKTAPGLFAANSNGQGVAAASVFRVKANGQQQFEKAVQFDVAQNRYVALPIDLSIPGDQVFLLLFGTGLRYHNSLSTVTATIGGIPVEVLYAGAQGDYLGLDQVNLRLPQSLTGRGEVSLALTVDGKAGNDVRVSFK